MRGRKPQIRPQKDLPDLDVDALITPVIKWPTTENLLARHFNQKITRLWAINGNGDKTNDAISKLMETLGTFKRIKDD